MSYDNSLPTRPTVNLQNLWAHQSRSNGHAENRLTWRERLAVLLTRKGR